MKVVDYSHKRLRVVRMGLMAGLLVVLLMLCGPVMPLAAASPGDGPGGVGETDGASALRWWFRTDAGVYADFDCTTLASTGGLVACWVDQSGHGEMVRQSDTEYQPVYRTTSRLEFDTAILSSTQVVQLFTNPSAGLSAIVVFNTSNYSETAVLVNHGASYGVNTDENFELGYTVGNTSQWGNFGLHRGDGNATVAAQDTITNNALTLMSTLVLTSGTAPLNSLAIYKNGAAVSLATVGSGWLATGDYATEAVPLDIGARRNGNSASYPDVAPDAFHAGEIAEIIIYTTTLNSAQRIIVENYLAAKYGITLNSAAVKYNITKGFNTNVAGIGREANGTHTLASSGGLTLQDSGFLQNNGDYMLIGHIAGNNFVNNALLPAGVQSRWNRNWYVDISDVGSNGGKVTLTFDFSDAGIVEEPSGIYVLLGRESPSKRFQSIQSSSYIVGDRVIFKDTPVLLDGWYYTLGEAANLDYLITDSYQPGGPAFNFTDIRSSGIKLTFPNTAAGEDSAIDVPINFTFNFYDRDYITASVGADGFIALKPGQGGDDSPEGIPAAGTPNGIAAGWWVDLAPTGYTPSSATVHYTTTDTTPREFIVQYTDVPRRNVAAYTSTFQIKLIQSREWVEVHYLSVNTDSSNASAGIEDQDGVKGLQYYYGDAPLQNVAVRYARPAFLIDKTVNALTPRAGERITYTVVIRSNLGAITNTAVMTDILDPGLVFVPGDVSILPAQPMSLSVVGQTLVARNFDIGAGQKVTFTIPATVAPTVTTGVELFNHVVLTHTRLSEPAADAIGIVPDDCWVRANGVTYDNVQQGIDAAASGSEVKIAGYCSDVTERYGLMQVGHISKTLTLRGGYLPGDVDWNTTYATQTTLLDARGDGRVLYVSSGFSVTLENLHLLNGDAGQSGSVNSYGGGIYAGNVQLTMNEVRIYQNLANQGGGVYVTGTLTLRHSEVFSNTADTYGGGLALYTVQKATLEGNEILSNTAGTDGGGLYLKDTVAWLRQGRIAANRANVASGAGGGLYVWGKSLTLTDAVAFEANTAYLGGGAYFFTSTVTATAASVVSNTAFRGAGLYFDNSQGQVTANDFLQNQAWGLGSTYGGGGIYALSGHLALSTNDFISNTANYGGGASLYEAEAMVENNRFVGNGATPSHGGGLYAARVTTMTLTANHFEWNISANGGGGAYIDSYNWVRLTANAFVSNTAKMGGGAYLKSTLSEVFSNTFTANSANEKVGGGGLLLERGTVVVEHNTLTQNRSVVNGGGALFSYPTGGRVLTNTWILNAAPSGRGGAMYVTNASALTIRANDFLTNTARGGGGLALLSSLLSVDTNFFSGNNATSASYGGGGLYVLSPRGGDAVNNTLTVNTAPYGGGAYFDTVNTFTFTLNLVFSNTASTAGGGLMIRDSNGVRVTDNVIRQNLYAGGSNGGGGLYVTGSRPVLTHNQIVSNTSNNHGGGLHFVGAGGQVNDNTIAYNQAATYGGGIFIGSSSSASFFGNEVYTNRATAGGGLYLNNTPGGVVEYNTLAFNLATDKGGGAAVYTANTARLNANQFLTNTANYGGGLWLYRSNALLTNNLVVGNMAQSRGSGMYLEAGAARVQHTTLVGNTGGDGSGIHLIRSSSSYAFPIFTNTIIMNQTVGVTVTSGNLATLNGTLWWGNTQDWDGAVVTNYDYFADPAFVDADGGDYHITLNSPAFNAGVDSGVIADMDGEARPQYGEYDIGADEYAGACFAKLNNADTLYTAIQDAVDASTQSTDLIKVAGMCSVARNVGGTMQTAYLNKSLTIQGGYTLTEWLNPDASLYPTTLGARDLGRVLYVTDGASVTLAGLTILGGNGSAGGGGNAGGGVYVNDGATLTLHDVTVQENAAGTGGGVYVNNAALLVQDSVIADNTATQGAGLYAENNGQVTVLRSTVRNNSAVSGGGFYLAGGAATLRNNTWEANSASASGGAGYLAGVTALVFEANMVRNNSAVSGGGLYLYQSPVTLERNTFISNTVTRGGGLYLDSNSNATLINTVIAHNTASAQGSGVYVQGSAPHFKHLTLATNTGGDGSGLLLTGSSTAWLTNTIIVQHTVGVTASTGSSAALIATLWGSDGWANGRDSVGTVISTTNYYGDPAFVAPAQMDYHLAETSAAIDRGVATDVVLDIDGLTRGASPDLGADEYRTCWVRLNDSPTDYVRVQDAINAGDHVTDVIKIAGYCTGVTAQPRRDLTATGVVSQIAYLTRTLTLQGGYTSTNFTTAYPVTQPTTLAAKDRGRVIYVTGNIASVVRDLTLVDGNAAGLGGAASGDAGGGIYVITGTVTLSQSLLASNVGTYGGGLYVASGAARLYNAVIAQNSGTQGGGAYGTQAALLGVHTTWAENTGASGLYLTGNSTAAFTNTVLVSHTVGITATSGSAVNLTATLWNNTQDTGGAGAFNNVQSYTGAPEFVAPPAYDYHIGSPSAAIDRGVLALPVDMDYESRPIGDASDLGADEYPAGLELTKHLIPTDVVAGRPITYTLWVTNTGLVAYRAYIRDILPAHVTPGGVETWAVYLYPQDVWSQTLVVQVASDYSGWLTNTASVTTALGLTDIYTLTSLSRMAADLSVVKVGTPASLSPGQPLTYTLTYFNAGPSVASGVVITDLLSTDIISANVTSTPPLTPVNGTRYVWEVGDVSPHTGGEIVIIASLRTGVAGNTSLLNTARVTGAIYDDVSSNNQDDVTLTVLNVAPVAGNDTATTSEDVPVTVNVLTNDRDVNGDSLTITGLEGVTQGVATWSGAFVTYTPTLNFNGTAVFTYVVTDGALPVRARITITVNPVNDPPAAVDDTATTEEDVLVNIAVLTNDTDVDNPSAQWSVTAVGAATSGAVTRPNATTVRYTPNLNFHGADAFTYTMSDGSGATATAWVTVTVTPVNDGPVAEDDIAGTPLNTPRLIAVLTNDTDVDGDSLLLDSVGTPTSGSATIQGNQVLYTPTTGFDGLATFTYTVSDGDLSDEGLVTVDVGAPNQAPTATGDITTTLEDTPVDIPVLDNDEDPDGDPLFIVAVGGAGRAVIFNALIRYTPAPNFYGSESFTYTMGDGLLTDTAWVTVTVESVNDAPVARADGYNTDADTPLSVAAPGVLANDTDVEGAPLSASLVGDVAHGALTLRPDGSFVYTPTVGFTGQDTFTYRAYDGADYSNVATVIIGIDNDPPVAEADAAETDEDTPVDIPVLDNDTDPDGDPLFVAAVGGEGRTVIVGALVRYTPAENFHGVESFTYTMSDGLFTDTAWVTVTVTPVNDAPVAVDDTLGTPAGVPREIAVLANDTDVDSAVLTLTSVGTPTSGSATIQNNRVLYTPGSGTAVFTYTVSDGDLSDTGWVMVTVGVQNHAPVAGDDTATTAVDTPVDIAVLTNDADQDTDPLFIAAVGGGRAVIVGNLVRYTPATGFIGTDGFTYTVSDGLLTDTAWVTVNVGTVNHAPVALNDNYTTPADTVLLRSAPGVLANDSDTDGDALTAYLVSAAFYGEAALRTDGGFTYTPTLGFTGYDTFTYRVFDGLAYSNIASVRINVGAVNQPPTASDATVNTDEDTRLTGQVSASDPNDDTLTYTVPTPTLYGSLTLTQSTGAWLYIPSNRTTTYQDPFRVIVSDGELTATATITIIVTADNDAPYFMSTPITSATATAVYAYSIHTADPDLNDAVTIITATVKPAWLMLAGTGATATLSGTPSAADLGEHPVTLEARDGGGLTVLQPFTITVSGPAQRLVFLPLVMRNAP